MNEEKHLNKEPFESVRHHETNSERYLSFLERVTRRQTAVAEASEQDSAKKTLEAWLSSVPKRYRSADLSTMEGRDVELVKSILDKSGSEPPSLYIHGERQSSKTYLGYAALRDIVERGLVRRDEIMVFSQEDINLWSQSGFKGKDHINNLLSTKYKLYLVENISGENASWWESFIAHVYNNSLSAVFTSLYSIRELADVNTFSRPLSVEATSRLNRVVNGNVVKTTPFERRY